MKERLERLRALLDPENELDAILVSQSENRRYLSGFTGSAGFLLISPVRAILATDFRYVEQARAEAPDFEIVQISGELSKWFPTLISDLNVKRLGFEESALPFSTYKELTETISTTGKEIHLVPTRSLVESLRALKDGEELDYIEKAAALSDAALEEIIPQVCTGITERELAWKLESYMRQNGSEPLPFNIIVASGPNAALPHARPGDRAILSNEPVVIDMGARVRGYCSDISRTICLGEGDTTYHRIYDIVLGAQLTAMETLQAGMNGAQVDHLARTVIAQAGYGDAFGHGLGHGVGLGAHEEPRLGPGSTSVIADGMVFTVEPGIYIPGWGGVRIEDMVVFEGGKVRQLTRAKKTWRK
jgi:Xaa-Pro aminopeptidase